MIELDLYSTSVSSILAEYLTTKAQLQVRYKCGLILHPYPLIIYCSTSIHGFDTGQEAGIFVIFSWCKHLNSNLDICDLTEDKTFFVTVLI